MEALTWEGEPLRSLANAIIMDRARGPWPDPAALIVAMESTSNYRRGVEADPAELLSRFGFPVCVIAPASGSILDLLKEEKATSAVIAIQIDRTTLVYGQDETGQRRVISTGLDGAYSKLVDHLTLTDGARYERHALIWFQPRDPQKPTAGGHYTVDILESPTSVVHFNDNVQTRQNWCRPEEEQDFLRRRGNDLGLGVIAMVFYRLSSRTASPDVDAQIDTDAQIDADYNQFCKPCKAVGIKSRITRSADTGGNQWQQGPQPATLHENDPASILTPTVDRRSSRYIGNPESTSSSISSVS